MDKPLRRNSKPYHIHAFAGPQFCRANAHVLISFGNIFIIYGFEKNNMSDNGLCKDLNISKYRN